MWKGAGGLSEQLEAENLDAWCESFGGDGSLDDVNEWVDCLQAAARCEGNQQVATQYPRALEWLGEVRPAMVAMVAPSTERHHESGRNRGRF